LFGASNLNVLYIQDSQTEVTCDGGILTLILINYLV